MVRNVDTNNFVAIVNLFESFNLGQDDDAKGIYGKLLNYFHRNKKKLLKKINTNQLPFSFVQWSDFMENIDKNLLIIMTVLTVDVIIYKYVTSI